MISDNLKEIESKDEKIRELQQALNQLKEENVCLQLKNQSLQKLHDPVSNNRSLVQQIEGIPDPPNVEGFPNAPARYSVPLRGRGRGRGSKIYNSLPGGHSG